MVSDKLKGQFAVGCKDGCAILGKIIHSEVKNGKCDINLDISDAYQNISFELIKIGINRYYPSLHKCHDSLYATPSALLDFAGNTICLSETGVKQGCALSSILFCLGLQVILDELKEEHRAGTGKLSGFPSLERILKAKEPKNFL